VQESNLPRTATLRCLVGLERLELSILSAAVSKTAVYAIPPQAHNLVGILGFEPRRQLAAVFETAVVAVTPYPVLHLVRQRGIEPLIRLAAKPALMRKRPVPRLNSVSNR
jgi:hypothetical protein